MDSSALTNAASIEFVSYSGAKAVSGITEEYPPKTDNTPQEYPKKAEILAISTELKACFGSGQEHLTPVQENAVKARELLAQDSQNPDNVARAVQCILDSVPSLESFKTDVDDVISACGSSAYYTTLKSKAQALIPAIEGAITQYNKTSNSADVAIATSRYTDVLTQWTAIIRTANEILNSL